MSLLGLIAGDAIGSVWEYVLERPVDFPFFQQGSAPTDDSIIAAAIADAALTDGDYRRALLQWGRTYPGADFGLRFLAWIDSDGSGASDSFGNGAAVRAAPLGSIFSDLDMVLEQAQLSAIPTHGHPEGVKGAQAVAGAVFLARIGTEPADIIRWVEATFGYALAGPFEPVPVDDPLRESCMATVPSALAAALTGTNFEDAIRKAIWWTRDADSGAAIAGAIAGQRFEVPVETQREVLSRLDDRLRTILDCYGRVEHGKRSKGA